MNTKELVYFKTVYEEKSINQAAKKLYITSQGLGRNIRALETEFQVKLFERTKKGVEPTPYAELLYKKTGALIQQLEELSAEFAKLKSGGGKFRIGLSYGILKILPMKVILEFIRENPRFQIEWREYLNEEVKNMVLSSDLDYGLIVGECASRELIQRKVMSRKIMLLVYKDHPFYPLEQVELD
ncbi:MAG TPA: LysR family transcriptional regulator, partial [Candidatus Blautia avistercoris]|nr:LysR family transcriptional regulator [Candidatus Blautia avistercoris]